MSATATITFNGDANRQTYGGITADIDPIRLESNGLTLVCCVAASEFQTALGTGTYKRLIGVGDMVAGGKNKAYMMLRGNSATSFHGQMRGTTSTGTSSDIRIGFIPYAPFASLDPAARVVIVGQFVPGQPPVLRFFTEGGDLLVSGTTTANFSGAMITDAGAGKVSVAKVANDGGAIQCAGGLHWCAVYVGAAEVAAATVAAQPTGAQAQRDAGLAAYYPFSEGGSAATGTTESGLIGGPAMPMTGILSWTGDAAPAIALAVPSVTIQAVVGSTTPLVREVAVNVTGRGKFKNLTVAALTTGGGPASGRVAQPTLSATEVIEAIPAVITFTDNPNGLSVNTYPDLVRLFYGNAGLFLDLPVALNVVAAAVPTQGFRLNGQVFTTLELVIPYGQTTVAGPSGLSVVNSGASGSSMPYSSLTASVPTGPNYLGAVLSPGTAPNVANIALTGKRPVSAVGVFPAQFTSTCTANGVTNPTSTRDVTVVCCGVVAVTATPDSIVPNLIAGGATQQFNYLVEVVDRAGATVAKTASWTCSAGSTITSAGVFSPGPSAAGPAWVRATSTVDSDKWDQVDFTIDPAPALTSVSISSNPAGTNGAGPTVVGGATIVFTRAIVAVGGASTASTFVASGSGVSSQTLSGNNLTVVTQATGGTVVVDLDPGFDHSRARQMTATVTASVTATGGLTAAEKQQLTDNLNTAIKHAADDATRHQQLLDALGALTAAELTLAATLEDLRVNGVPVNEFATRTGVGTQQTVDATRTSAEGARTEVATLGSAQQARFLALPGQVASGLGTVNAQLSSGERTLFIALLGDALLRQEHYLALPGTVFDASLTSRTRRVLSDGTVLEQTIECAADSQRPVQSTFKVVDTGVAWPPVVAPGGTP